MLRSMLRFGWICVSSGILLAQTSGDITGVVKDQSGAIVGNAAVTATNIETNVARATVTNTSGIYSFPELTPGRYQVKVTAPGFETALVSLELQVQQTARFDFDLKLGNASQTVEVTAGADLL